MRKIFSMVPIMKKMSLMLLVSVFLLPLSARAEIRAGSFELSPFAGYNFFENEQNLNDGPIFGGRLGYNFTKHFGMEGTVEYSPSGVDNKSRVGAREGQFRSPTDSVDVMFYHVDAVYHFMPDSKFTPFVVAGIGGAHYDPRISTQDMTTIDFGVGAKYWMTDNIALRLDVRDNIVSELFQEAYHNVNATAGVTFAFGGEGKSAQAAQVADKVDPQAASPADSDKDGVPDTLDKCPGTPAGVAVDKDGCPPDSDKDGVPDYLDRCLHTPAGVAVDKDGCPLDTDKDGVADYLDKCPGTPAGVVVDKNGCPPPVVEKPKVEGKALGAQAEPKTINLTFEDVHFDFDKSTLKPEAKSVLKKNIQLLKENPNTKIRIAGYTSASGTEAYNQKLSERRAKAVKKYLVSEGVITADKLSIIGYGKKNPAVHETDPLDLYSAAAKANMRALFEIIVK